MVGAGGLLVVSNPTPQAAEPVPVPSVVESTSAPDASTSASEPPTSTGSVAPPVSVDTVTDEGDEGLVLDDFTPIDPPQPPTAPRTVPLGSVADGKVSGALPDGFYLGFLEGVGASDSVRVRFDSTAGPAFEAPLDDLLLVSLRVDARDPSHPGSAVVSTGTLQQLLAQGEPTYSIPESDDLVIIEGSYLLTVADGRLVGIEGLA